MTEFVPTEHPSKGPYELSIQCVRPWSFIFPRIYRLMERKYVDAFFEDGSLMLSSFTRFSKHEDEQRRDVAEGVGVRFLHGSDSTTAMAAGRGFDCYVLCGSCAYTETVKGAFPDADGCLIIDNPAEFASLVSAYVPGFKAGLAGQCIYQDSTTIERHSTSNVTERMKSGDMDVLRQLHDEAGGPEELFVKSSRYAAQLEYRMLWASRAQIEDALFIKCPEARQFCRRR